MPKSKKNDNTTETPTLNFTVGNVSEIPKVVRAGRTSRYAPLYERAKTLANEEMIALPISKYSQVQAFRPRLEEMGLSVSVRKTGDTLTAFVKHTPPETKS